MAKGSHGPRKGTRKSLRSSEKEKNTPNIEKHLQDFEVGDKVVIKPEPSFHKGLPHRRFFGKSGVVVEKRGNAYVLKVEDDKKEKKVISKPAHLKKVN